MLSKYSLEFKIIFYIILFGILMVSFINIHFISSSLNNYEESTQSKHQLLINTIEPVVNVNVQFGLHDANKEYLTEVIYQNKDIEAIVVHDKNHIVFSKPPILSIELKENSTPLTYISKTMNDKLTYEELGTIEIYFSQKESHDFYETLFINIGFLTLIFLLTLGSFLVFIKKDMSLLKALSKNIAKYEPALNNYPMETIDKNDELSVIHNAVVGMISRINTYTDKLDTLNKTLDHKVKQRTQELSIANKKLEELSNLDPLTELPNRRMFDSTFPSIWSNNKRNGHRTTLIICDLDHFKSINDNYGHQAGDVVLQKVAEVLHNTLHRENDFCFRIGGEEFVILLSDTSDENSHKLCESIRYQLKALFPMEVEENIIIENVTMSFGISSIKDYDSYIPDLLFSQADSALYDAKSSGRDRVINFKN